LSVIVVVAFFSKYLLGGLAIFMMADNKKQRVCVKFCFLLGSNQSLAEKKNFTQTLCSLLSTIIKIAKPPSRHLEKKPQQQ
jgi:5-carboxymethyl-2-hydroxymuconate isomerase